MLILFTQTRYWHSVIMIAKFNKIYTKINKSRTPIYIPCGITQCNIPKSQNRSVKFMYALAKCFWLSEIWKKIKKISSFFALKHSYNANWKHIVSVRTKINFLKCVKNLWERRSKDVKIENRMYINCRSFKN